VALMDRELVGEGVSIHLALDKKLPPVRGNRIQMQQVLINIFTNAIESMRAAGGRPRRIAIRSEALDDGDVLLEIKDSGIGIAPDEMARILDAFYTTKPTGTGLGLSLSRTIVEEHGGRLWASQGDEPGATLHMRLPRSRFSARMDLDSAA
jgi:signal transduction histidine kinase